ncbi:MAG: hypothetical protein KDD69_14785 [Bdellovibrionales bacterium]|nr:hypothetical protein [Bdellovibrionales bacterium]
MTGAAAKKADERLLSKTVRQRSRIASVESSVSLAESFRLDTVDGIILESKHESEFFEDYRGWQYLRYLTDVVDFDEVDELEQSSFAQKLLLYHSARTLVEHIEQTPLERHYRRLVSMAKELRDKTTFTLIEDGKGSLDVEHGESDEEITSTAADDPETTASGRRLVEFKLHASAKNGIEPRVRFSENLTLRLDPLNRDALLEFRRDF